MNTPLELAITGVGYISSEGTGIENFFRQVNTQSKTDIIDNYDPQGYLGKRGLRYMNKATKMYCNLAFQCINQNNLEEKIADIRDRVGLYDGSELSNIADGFIFDLIAKVEGPDLASPMSAPNTIANASSSQMAIKSKITGPNFTVSGGACGSLQAMSIASLHLRQGITDYAIIASTEVNSKYHDAVRRGEGRDRQKPFRGSNEFGVALTVERIDDAIANNHKVLARIKAVKSGQQLEQESAEDLIQRLITSVLQSSGVDASEIDAIIAGGGAHNIDPQALRARLQDNDMAETAAYYPELIYGSGDNAGGFAGILYGIGLFQDKIVSGPKAALENGAIAKKIASDTDLNLALVFSIDKSGYGIVTLISK